MGKIPAGKICREEDPQTRNPPILVSRTFFFCFLPPVAGAIWELAEAHRDLKMSRRLSSNEGAEVSQLGRGLMRQVEDHRRNQICHPPRRRRDR